MAGDLFPCLLQQVPEFRSIVEGTIDVDVSGQLPQDGYRIDQPGTITFTVGVKISGKVEKPQVMIFLPKEKTQYRNEMVHRSFREELSQPLPFTPLME